MLNTKTNQLQSQSQTLLIEDMNKTGIESIDKFFNYGERVTGMQKLPFTSLLPTLLDMFKS